MEPYSDGKPIAALASVCLFGSPFWPDQLGVQGGHRVMRSSEAALQCEACLPWCSGMKSRRELWR